MAGEVFTDRLTDLTYYYILPNITDNVSISTVAGARTLTRTVDWEGVSYNAPIQIGFSDTGGAFNGMDIWQTSATNNTRQLTFYITGDYQAITIPGIEEAINSNSESQAIKLLSAKFDEAKISQAQRFGSEIYSFGLGKNFDGYGNMVDNGTNAPTYGGQSRTTYPFLKADVTDVTALNNGTITLSFLSSEFDNVSAASSTSESPTLGITSKTIWTYIEGLVQPMLQARYEATAVVGYDRVDGGTPQGTNVPIGRGVLAGAGGFISLTWRGRPFAADDSCISGTFYWLNENYFDFAVQKSSTLRSVSSNLETMKGFYDNVPMPSAFQFRDFMSSINQWGRVGTVILLGNLICRQPRRNGKLINITGN